MKMPLNSVYITSLPRSGSTLLSMLLGSHDGVAALGEFVLFGQALSTNSLCSCGKPLQECDFWGEITRQLNDQRDSFSTLVYPFDFSKTGFQKKLSKLYSYALRHHHALLLDLTAAFPQGYPYHMKKAADNTKSLLEMLANRVSDTDTIFLDASKTTTRLDYLITMKSYPIKVISLVRDGRGTLHSWLKDSDRSFPDTVRAWRWHMENQLRSLKEIREEDKIVVRYEDLCRNTESELKRICDFLQITFQEKMLSMEGPFHMLGGNPGTIGNSSTVRLDIGWEKTFTQEELNLFEELAGEVNREMGY
ncbi:MAG: sulfotransferase [Bacteroidales bacterium]|nr:sulfotransferase [Bacteroidales bacterium]